MKNIKAKIEKIKKENKYDNPLTVYICGYILDHFDEYDTLKDWFKDLLQANCASGFIGSLIYHKDTHAFFDEYFADIEKLTDKLEESTGQLIRHPKGQDLKTWYAWLGFKETARQVADKIGLEL